MKTLADIVNAPKKASLNLEDCVIVKQQDDGTYNIACTINGNKTYVNYVNPSKCSDNKLYVQYGKKEDSWKKDRWYQVEPPVETKEDKNV